MTPIPLPAGDAIDTMLAAIDEPAFMLDRAGHCLTANAAACALGGGDLEAVLADLLAVELTSPGEAAQSTLRDLVAAGTCLRKMAVPRSFPNAADTQLAVTLIPLPAAGPTIASSCLMLHRRPPLAASETERLYRLFFERMPGHSYIHRPSPHPDSGLVVYSPQIEQVIGFPPERWVNDRAFREQIVHPADRAHWRAAYAAVTATTREFTVEFRVVTSTGEIRWLRDAANLVTDVDGTAYWLGFLSDITAQRCAEAAAAAAMADLERANAELLRISQAKSEFVSVISHEFRTPLTSIQGFSELLIDTDDLPRAEAQSFLQTINDNSRQLARMVNDVLDLDQLERAGAALKLDAVDLNKVVRQVLASLRATTARHALRPRLEPALPLIRGDHDQLGRVVTNLVSNAIKYSPAGGPVTVTTTMTDATVELSVADQGLGIPADDRERVFERYGRLNRPEQMAIKGVGLGLPIAHQIVARHGGRIWIEANDGAGTIIRVTLPITHPAG